MTHNRQANLPIWRDANRLLAGVEHHFVGAAAAEKNSNQGAVQ